MQAINRLVPHPLTRRVHAFNHACMPPLAHAGGVIPVGDFPWRWTLCAWSLAYNNPQILVIPDTLQVGRAKRAALQDSGWLQQRAMQVPWLPSALPCQTLGAAFGGDEHAGEGWRCRRWATGSGVRATRT